MKKLSIYILSTCMTFAYVLSVVGVGVHTCQQSGKQRVVLLAHETCRCGSEHEKTSSCAGGEERCCDVAYRILQADQEVHSAKSLLKGVTEYFTWLFVPVMTLESSYTAPAVALNHSPPPCTSNTLPSIYRLSQLRV